MGILSFFRRTKAASAPKRVDSAPVAVPSVPSPSPAARAGPSGGGAGGAKVSSGVLLRPRVAEKAARALEHGWYTFLVARAATKQDVRRAVEEQFSVHVRGVHVMNVRGKARRRGRIEGRVPGYRKAMVTLKEGERIDLSSGEAAVS